MGEGIFLLPHYTLERPRVPSVGTPWTVPQGSLLSHYALWGQSSCPSLVTGNPCCGFVGQPQVTASHPKPSVELLWDPLPKSQGKIQGSKAISIQFPVSFSIGTFFFFFKPSSQHASKGHVPSFLDHYSEVLQLYSSQSGLGLLG